VKVLLVVASETGRTRRMAEAAADGAREAGAQVELCAAAGATDEQLLAADAVMLCSGVHMAGIESAMRAFLERTAPLWMAGRLRGKLGAALVTAGAGGRGGGELALISLLASLAQHGMLLVGMPNRLDEFGSAGCHWGPIAWTNPRAREAGPTAKHLAAARAHGRHVAECTARWLAGES
jgi:NAD(P)H dehydrogenase (quinone)